MSCSDEGKATESATDYAERIGLGRHFAFLVLYREHGGPEVQFMLSSRIGRRWPPCRR